MMENRSSLIEHAPISDSVIRSLEKILKSSQPHIVKALAVVAETFTKYDMESVWFSINAGKDNTVALYLLAAHCYKKFSEQKVQGLIPEDAKFTRLVSTLDLSSHLTAISL